LAFGDDHYVYAAQDAMRWLDGAMSQSMLQSTSKSKSKSISNPKTKTLLHGSSGGAAFASDYACMVQALLDVYEATYSMRWLTRALELQQQQDDALWSGEALRYAGGVRNVPPSLRGLA